MSNSWHYIIIDDDSYSNFICQMVLKKYMSPLGIETFTEADMGLQYIKSEYIVKGINKPTILLLDINMPIMNGWEFIDEFEKLPEEIKCNIQIYLLSSSVDNRDAQRAAKINSVKQYLIKPLTKEIAQAIFINPVPDIYEV